jgi:L,D-transpeptidase catalytic domain
MRSLLVATILMLCAAGAAQAKVSITIDKDAQMMTVAVDGVTRYHWPVSTGIPSRETPNGTFRAFRMEESHFSKEFDDAPMPHSIFFTKIGHAIHGTDSEGRLGTPASHGCVRLSKDNAATLYALVEEQGVLNSTVTLTGSASVALARNPRRNTAMARTEPGQPDQQYQQYQQPYAQPQYSTQPQSSDSGEPMVLTPQPQFLFGRRPAQQQRADDGYIYPADGSSTDQRYPAPRSIQRASDGQAYYRQQPQGYGAQGHGAYGDPYQQQRSYYQPQQRYYPN